MSRENVDLLLTSIDGATLIGKSRTISLQLAAPSHEHMHKL